MSENDPTWHTIYNSYSMYIAFERISLEIPLTPVYEMELKATYYMYSLVAIGYRIVSCYRP